MPSPQTAFAELYDLLQITNVEKDKVTCVGHAPSKGRRCWNPIAAHNRAAAESIIRQLPPLFSDRRALEVKLQQLAQCSLCVRYHQSQSSQVALQWYKTIVREINARTSLPATPRQIATAVTANVSFAAVAHIEVVRRTSAAQTAVGSVATVLPPRGPRTSPTTAHTTTTTSPTAPSTAPRHPHRRETNGHVHTAASDTTGSGSEDGRCDICYRQFEEPVRTPCGHEFCRECVTIWLDNHQTCPYDRRPLHVADLVPIVASEAEDETCAICYDTVDDPALTPCGHTFCQSCISSWLQNHSTCPYDRRPLRMSNLVTNSDVGRRQQSRRPSVANVD